MKAAGAVVLLLLVACSPSELTPEEEAKVPTVCSSLDMALEALAADHEFLLAGDVFSKDQIDAYCEVKWEEVMRWETTPSPVEFDMYYSS